MTQIVLDRVAEREFVGAAAAPAQAAKAGTARSALGRSVRPLRPRRPARGSGRGAGPTLRPVEACPAPRLAQTPVAAVRSCVVPSPEADVSLAPASSAPAWRLTDRGVATVLVVGLMIMVAALTVVGLTAFRVTGGTYQPTVSASLPR